MRSALLLGARYLYPYIRRKVFGGIKGFLSSGTFVGKKNLDLFRPRMSKSSATLHHYGLMRKRPNYVG